MVLNHLGVYQDVNHVNCQVALVDEILEDIIHHHLEGGWTVGKTKKHDKGFEKALIHPKGGFPLTSLLNSYVVISPIYIQLHEVLCLGV